MGGVNLLRNRALLALLVGVAVIGGIVDAMQPPAATHPASSNRLQSQFPGGSSSRPNVVFILTDDLSMNLLRFMPHLQAMQQSGMTFTNYFVSDSLCCPSRSSIFAGNFPHNTGVFGNVGKQGGFQAFYSRGEERHTFAVALREAGYRTAMMGKYLNGYMGRAGTPAAVPETYVPPGWSEWDVGGPAYAEFDYTLNENGTLHSYGHQPDDYLTDVLTRKGIGFINVSAQTGNPFFLELATFAPHGPYIPAPRNANDFPGLQAPRPPSFNVLPTSAPRWLAGHAPLAPSEIDRIDQVFRLRAQAVEAVDNMIGQIELALAANHISDNTYLVFSSDNGLHTGEYRLTPGKLTAFDTDIHVPLVVAGPRVPAGASTRAMTENVDLAKTFAAIGGTRVPSDGHSLVPLLRGLKAAHWGDAILVEHHGNDLLGFDPDFQQSLSGSPRTYEAMRTHSFLYVEYNSGEREFYDLRRDPDELHNIAGTLTGRELAELHTELQALRRCRGGPACWAARHVAPGPWRPNSSH